MANSMTGFGRAKAEDQDLEFFAEVKSLNHRYLDVNMRLPRVISFLEEDIRSLVQDRLDRGRIDIYISASSRTGNRTEVQLNQALVESYIACFKRLSHNYDVQPDIPLSALVGLQDVFLIREREQDEEIIKRMVMIVLNEAIDRVKDMRAREGEKLKKDIIKKGHLMRNIVEAIELRSPIVVDEYRIKLANRISELLEETDLDQDRLNSEVVIFADRSSIDEELVRLKSHLHQMEEILGQRGAIGRKLDFLVQEMNREANTIGSKANDLGIINMVVEIKSEIEKIREQVQNIE